MRRSLSDQEVETLAEIVVRHRAEGSPLISAIRNGSLSDDQLDELVDLVAEELAARGFDADYEPTSYGVKLESLIDVLNEA
ncbi:MAG: hypothetical protein ACJ76I_11210 [Gaiellaceae bacterium]